MRNRILTFYIIILIGCGSSNNVEDDSSQNVIKNYEEKYGVSINHKIENDFGFNSKVKIVSEKDSISGLWKTTSSGTFLEINEINKNSVNFLLRFMDASKGGIQIKKGRAVLACEECPLEIKNTHNNYYRVKRYICENDSFIIVLRMDTISKKTKAFAEYYE